MSTKKKRVAGLMSEGCPVDLTSPMSLYGAVVAYLDKIGQADGNWTEDGEKVIPKIFRESKLASDMQKYFKPGYVVKTTEKIEQLFDKHNEEAYDFSHDISWMSNIASYEFMLGWKIFPCGNGKGDMVWIVTGILFPEYDGETEGWIVFAEVSEIFPEKLLKAA